MIALTEELIECLWQKAGIVEGYDPRLYRQDACSAWIIRSQFGKRSAYGWGIDRIIPHAMGGTDDSINLRPLHWQNCESKGGQFPNYTAAVISQGSRNVTRTHACRVHKATQKELRNLLAQLRSV